MSSPLMRPSPVLLPPWHNQFGESGPEDSKWTHQCHTGCDTTRRRGRRETCWDGGGTNRSDLQTHMHANHELVQRTIDCHVTHTCTVQYIHKTCWCGSVLYTSHHSTLTRITYSGVAYDGCHKHSSGFYIAPLKPKSTNQRLYQTNTEELYHFKGKWGSRSHCHGITPFTRSCLICSPFRHNSCSICCMYQLR